MEELEIAHCALEKEWRRWEKFTSVRGSCSTHFDFVAYFPVNDIIQLGSEVKRWDITYRSESVVFIFCGDNITGRQATTMKDALNVRVSALWWLEVDGLNKCGQRSANVLFAIDPWFLIRHHYDWGRRWMHTCLHVVFFLECRTTFQV